MFPLMMLEIYVSVAGCMVVFSTHDWAARCFPPWIDHVMRAPWWSDSVTTYVTAHATGRNCPDQKARALALAPFVCVSWIPSQRRQSKWLGRRPQADQTQVATAPQARISPPQPTIHGLMVSMDTRHTRELGFDSLLTLFQKFKPTLSYARAP